MVRNLTLCLLLCALGASPAYAAGRDDVSKNKKEMAEASARKDKLAEQNKQLREELAGIQEKLVKAAEAVQTAEAELSAVEEKLRILNTQYTLKKDTLEVRKKNLASLVQAALRLSQTPPEAVVLMPEGSEKTMKAARALKMATASIKEEAESIRLQMAELERLQAKMNRQRDVLTERQTTLSEEKKLLSAQLVERKALQEKLNREEQQQAEKVARLAKQADDLQELVSTIENAVRKPTEKGSVEMPEEQPQGKKGKVRSFVAAKGKIRPPLAGKLVQTYGSTQGKNETSKGMVIQARPGAQVTAPYDGEVVYAGTFLNYGRMAIIRHSNDFHTLLSGLASVDVRPGEFLLEGEPIGAMGDRDSDARLYIELRKDNQPIDPAPWINVKKD